MEIIMMMISTMIIGTIGLILLLRVFFKNRLFDITYKFPVLPFIIGGCIGLFIGFGTWWLGIIAFIIIGLLIPGIRCSCGSYGSANNTVTMHESRENISVYICKKCYSNTPCKKCGYSYTSNATSENGDRSFVVCPNCNYAVQK